MDWLPLACLAVFGSADVDSLPVLSAAGQARVDYLLDPDPFVARVGRDVEGREIVLDNGLIRRVWRIEPNAACVSFDNLTSGEALLRSVRPEARITVDGTEHSVGGLVGQPGHAFLTPAWLDTMRADPDALHFTGLEVGTPAERLSWGRRRHAAPDAAWPPRGVALRLDFATRADALHRLRVEVHYELYDGLPAMSKWVTVRNAGDVEVTLDRLTVEELAVVEATNWAMQRGDAAFPRPDSLHVETDFAFRAFNHEPANQHVVHWRSDPLYTSQVDWDRRTPCLLVCEPTYGPARPLAPGASLTSFRVFELAQQGDRERRGLALRRMYRTVAPWVTENPITHHLLSHDPERVREAIDQAAEVGFEAIILSFGSGFHMESRDDEYLRTWRAVAEYANSKGIELGSYSLFSSRDVGAEHMIVSPEGQRPTHGRCPAVTSAWGLDWLDTIRSFYVITGFDQFENDGPYPGDVDVTPRPPLQRGIDDSRWIQWQLTAELYADLRAQGVYINAPDYYYLNGSNKCGMGYREVNWSLPRAQQVLHTRQNIYDGTWEKTPSMGWMHVPLSEYHGGGAATTIEPLSEHLDHYERMLLSNLGMGVQAHYRGPRLFDTDETKERVRSVVAWFKEHRDILESDIVHGRRADGRRLDWVLHVNPRLETRGMLVLYNPLDEERTETLRIDLYYAGLTDRARLTASDGTEAVHELDGTVMELTCTVPARGMSWFALR